jgi:nucleotide-binding universal stress UspA family protein
MKILLAVDSSAASVVALEEVASRPWPPGTNIEVLNVVESWDVPSLMEGLNRSSTELLNGALRRLTDAKIKATTLTLCGEPKARIIDRAGDISADLVVVGSRGATGLTKFLLGSVAAAVARFAPCSVEIVRPCVHDEDNPSAIRILLATDGSECSEFAARQVADGPWPLGSEVHILSVVGSQCPCSG